METTEVHRQICDHLTLNESVVLNDEGAWVIAYGWSLICDFESLKDVDTDSVYALLVEHNDTEDADVFIERFVDERSRAALDHTGDPAVPYGEDATVSEVKHV